MHAKIDLIQVSLDNQVNRAEALDSERVKLLVSKKSLKRKLQLKSDHSPKVEDLKYRLDGAVAKDRWSDTIINSRSGQLLTARSDVDKYCQRLLLHIQRFMADVADHCRVFLYNLCR